ncbi:Fc.00g098980.m01.CDS01 [Cosmosporella sp. VM-42]
MDGTRFLVARNLDELSHVLQLVPRDGKCVKCDDSTHLECPKCSDGESCQFTVPLDCTQCAKSICMADDTTTTEKKGKDGPSIGGIVGGVVGGIIAIAILTYLVWRYCIKPKRSQDPQSIYEPDADPVQGSEKDTASRRTRPSSTHTVHSIASTVLTRASNIIQIAYIPGVTNRATPTSPTVLVPPVPPIPMQHAEGKRGSGYEEPHFFVPGDLRDSTYSGLSGYSDRTSYARTSYAPRSSIASTIYGKQAQVLPAAQTGMRAKPTVVSVKSVGNGSSDGNTPPVPSINFEKFGGPGGRPKSGASAFSVGSTFLNSANTATQARAQVVKVGGGLKKIEINSTKSDAGSSTSSTPSLAPVSPATSNGKVARDSNAITIIEDSPSVDQGPFSDPPERSSPQKSTNPPSLGAVIEDQAGEGDRSSERVSSPQRRDSSPFGDQHATKE